jgi:uncharacterized protein YaiL (DUF2058 family)
MSISLRDQLLAAGLGTKKQAKQIEHQQGRETWRNREDPAAATQKRAAAQAQAHAAKATRDQELNRKRKEEAERRARWAQIKQLVEQNAIARPLCEEYFNFIDRGKVRRICADAALREQIIGGTLAIARCEGRYHLVPAETGARIAEREPRAVVALQQDEGKPSVAAEDDPYKDFIVPDDLKW